MLKNQEHFAYIFFHSQWSEDLYWLREYYCPLCHISYRRSPGSIQSVYYVDLWISHLHSDHRVFLKHKHKHCVIGGVALYEVVHPSGASKRARWRNFVEVSLKHTNSALNIILICLLLRDKAAPVLVFSVCYAVKEWRAIEHILEHKSRGFFVLSLLSSCSHSRG